MIKGRIGVIDYGEGDGPRIDTLLSGVAADLAKRGFRLAGAIQHNTEDGDRCRCDMILEDLASGRRVDISERRGPEARGCRLDSFALESVVGAVMASLETLPDLLVVNRFGKREAGGHGFRSAIEAALAADIAILVAVGPENRPAWDDFAAGFDTRLDTNVAAVLGWCEASRRRPGDPSHRAGAGDDPRPDPR